MEPADSVPARLLPGGPVLDLPAHRTFHASLAALVQGFPAPCDGRGLCGLCRIRLSPAPPASDSDLLLLPARLLDEGWRLACRHSPEGPVDVELPPGARVARPTRAGRRRPPIPGEVPELAAAIDLGTTNLAVQLIDPDAPAILGTASAPNPQAAWGEEVLSRAAFAARPGGLETLRSSLFEALNSLLAGLKTAAGREGAPVRRLAAAGNPVMTAIFAGADPSPAVRPPYPAPDVPALLGGLASSGLDVHPRAAARLLPAAAGFLGGDVTGGLVNAGAADARGERAFFLDMGTNGEMVLTGSGVPLAATAAAGPALEGRRVSCGMRAAEGAVDSVRLEADLALGVIGGGPPVGICGSGLLELLAALLRAGLVMPDGRLLDASEAAAHPRPRLAARLVTRRGEPAFLVAEGPGEGVYLTRSDVRELQLAKGAVRAGVEMLLREAGVGAGGVARVVVAGGFGYRLDPRGLTDTGFLPQAWGSLIEFAGNTSLAGARDCLLSASSCRAAARIAAALRVLNLAARPDFRSTFLASLAFPE